jgi:hypothetical protein
LKQKLAWFKLSMPFLWHRILRTIAWIAMDAMCIACFIPSARSTVHSNSEASMTHNSDKGKQTSNHTFDGLENFLGNPLERQIIRMLQIHKEENEGQILCQKYVG